MGMWTTNYIRTVWTFDASQLHMDAFPTQEPGKVADQQNNVIGHYEIKDGIVTITWDVEDFLWQITEGGIEWGKVNVTGEYDKDITDKKDKDEVSINNKVVAELYPNGYIGDVDVEKTYVGFDASTGLMTWDLTVKSTKGTASEVDITDTMSGSYSSISITENGSPVTTTQNGSSYSWTIPKMDANTTKTYRVTANVLGADGKLQGGERTNKASASSTNSGEEDIEDHSDPVGENLKVP